MCTGAEPAVMAAIMAGEGAGTVVPALLPAAVGAGAGAGLGGGLLGTAAGNLGADTAALTSLGEGAETMFGQLTPWQSLMGGADKLGKTLGHRGFQTALMGANMLGQDQPAPPAAPAPMTPPSPIPSTQELFANRGIVKQSPMMPPMMGLDPVSLFLLQQRFGMTR